MAAAASIEAGVLFGLIHCQNGDEMINDLRKSLIPFEDFRRFHARRLKKKEIINIALGSMAIVPG